MRHFIFRGMTGPVILLFTPHSYLMLQLRGFATGHRLSVEPPVLEFIAGLSLAELEGVADHLSRLPVGEPEPI